MTASIALLANPESGHGEAAAVEAALTRLGATVQTFELDEADAAARSGTARLAVAGGDGSLGAAAEAAARARLPLAVIPTGTANDFAARHGLPGELEQACRLAALGTELRALELAFAGPRPFVNVAGAGLAPRAARSAHGLKARLGALAYPLGALRAGLLAKPIRCRVRVDGTLLHDGEAWQVSVASGGAFGGGAELHADPSDGRLDVSVIAAHGRIRLIGHAYALRRGTLEDRRDVRHARCATVELELDEGEALNVDGEVVAARELDREGRISLRVERAAFDLVVPPILRGRA